MELIHPPKNARNTVLRSDGEVVEGEVVSELGVFGTCLFTTTPVVSLGDMQGVKGKGDREETTAGKRMEILHNEEGGYLLRTKASGSDEGGVAAGFSSLDSVVLFGEEHL